MGEKSLLPKENIENGMCHDHQSDSEGSEEEFSGNNDEGDDMSPEEFDALNNRIDELNEALDSMEQKNDDIYSELLQLLQANKEIRQQMQATTPNNSKPDAETKPTS